MAIDPNILPTPLEYATPQQQALADALARRRGGGLDPSLVARALMEGKTEQPEDSLRRRTEAVTKMLEPGPQPDAAAAAPVQTAQAAGLPHEPVVPGGPAMAPDTRRALGILQGGGAAPSQPLIGFIARMTGLGVPMHEIMEFVRQRQALMPQYGVSPEGLVTRQQPGRMPQVMGPLPGHPGKPGEMDITGVGKIPTRTFYGPDGRLHTEYVMPGGPGGGAAEGGAGGPTYGTARTIEDFQELGARAAARKKGLEETEAKLAEHKTLPIKESITKGDVASKAVQFLNTMDEIGKLPDAAKMNEGPHAHLFLKLKQFSKDVLPEGTLERLGIGGIATAEAIDKLNGFLAQVAAKELTNRPTQFDFKTFLERNPGIETSREGRQFLIDMLRQSYKQDLEVAKLAQKIRDPSSWFEDAEKVREKHPITATYHGQPITSADQVIPEFNTPPTPTKQEYRVGDKIPGVGPDGKPALLELKPDGWYANGRKIELRQQ